MSLFATPLRFLPVNMAELTLATSLLSGQSFRWKKLDQVIATRPDPLSPGAAPLDTKPESLQDAVEWAFGWGDRTVCLRQDDEGIYYRSLFPPTLPPTAYVADLERDTTLPLLRSYFQLDTPLAPLYAQWEQQDKHFKKKLEQGGDHLRGIRVLAQDPWQTLFSFICSANNNIGRITLMVNRVCERLGTPLPHPSSFTPACVYTPTTVPTSLPPSPRNCAPAPTMFAFPPPSALTPASTDPLLRELGFGYRAPFIQWSAQHLISTAKEAGLTPDEYLATLQKANFKGEGGLAGAREKLLEFKGVGRKVADCCLLFGFGWTNTVPVDTHVFQIAIRDYSFPASKTTALTPILHDKVCAKLEGLWGTHAGWAQQVLFFADLKSSSPSPKKLSSTTTTTTVTSKTYETVAYVPGEVVKSKFDLELAELMSTPAGANRRRRTTVLKTKVVIEADSDDDDGAVAEDDDAALSYPSPAASGGKAVKRRASTARGSPSAGRVKKVKVEA